MYFVNSNLKENVHIILYGFDVTFTDPLSVVNKKYVDFEIETAIDEAKLHISDGIYSTLNNNRIPK